MEASNSLFDYGVNILGVSDIIKVVDAGDVDYKYVLRPKSSRLLEVLQVYVLNFVQLLPLSKHPFPCRNILRFDLL